MPFLNAIHGLRLLLSLALLTQTLGLPVLNHLYAHAAPAAAPPAIAQSALPPFVDKAETWENLQKALIDLYGEEATQQMLPKVRAISEAVRKDRNKTLKQLEAKRSVDWYKDEVVYMLYPDRFNVKGKGNTSGGFDEVAEALPYLKKLGVTTLYLLPFMASPMGDAGFDVSGYREARADLGGMEGFRRFAKRAKAMGFKLKGDLVLNHVSEKHPWFQAALRGDAEKLIYFSYRKAMPPAKGYKDEARGYVVDYTEAEGKISSRRLIFPEQTDTHFRKEMINGTPYYFYHTFYPFQIDLNWENPKLFLEMLEVLGFWANEGIDIFRLDAIPYLIKTAGTDAENRPRTHRAIEALSLFLQMTAPASVLQAEANQWPKDILPYFGEAEGPTDRTDEVQIAYNFPYMPALWASMLKADASAFWQAFKDTPEIPETSAWAMFLRVHDELTLEMTDAETRKTLYETLSPRGESFRKGYGVSGRMADFLLNDPRRIHQAFALMMSFPGLPIIYYGDEVAETQSRDFGQAMARARKDRLAKSGADLSQYQSFYDSRDINRTPLLHDTVERLAEGKGTPLQRRVFTDLARLNHVRLSSEALRRGTVEPLADLPAQVLGLWRKTDATPTLADDVLILHNLGAKAVTVTLPMEDETQTSWDDLLSKRHFQTPGGQMLLQPYESVYLQLR